jgi:histidinol-phosphate aminotransferase
MRPRVELEGLTPTVHGGAPTAVGAVLDFSVSTNPLGPSPRARAAAAQATIGRYPERDSATLRGALAAALDVAPEHIVVSNGSVELFWLLALCYLRSGDRALVVGPTFAEYARAAHLLGARVTEIAASAEETFRPSVDQICRAIQEEQPRMVFLCNPNNPTGVYLNRLSVERLLAATPGLLVLDEAYLGFAPEPWDVRPLLTDPRLVVARSMTKDHGLPGLRLGYALAPIPVAAALRSAQPPWSVNAVAQAAGLAALAEPDHAARGRALAREAITLLAAGLSELGFDPLPSATNFLLVGVGDATAVCEALLTRGIHVRDCTSFGLPRHIRISARPLDECRVLLDAARTLSGPARAPIAARRRPA